MSCAAHGDRRRGESTRGDRKQRTAIAFGIAERADDPGITPLFAQLANAIGERPARRVKPPDSRRGDKYDFNQQIAGFVMRELVSEDQTQLAAIEDVNGALWKHNGRPPLAAGDRPAR